MEFNCIIKMTNNKIELEMEIFVKTTVNELKIYKSFFYCFCSKNELPLNLKHIQIRAIFFLLFVFILNKKRRNKIAAAATA